MRYQSSKVQKGKANSRVSSHDTMVSPTENKRILKEVIDSGTKQECKLDSERIKCKKQNMPQLRHVRINFFGLISASGHSA